MINIYPLIQSAEDIKSIVSITDITVGGILLAICIYLGWQNHKMREHIKDIQDQRLEDFEKMSVKYQEMAEKNFRHVQQLTELRN